MNSVNKSEQLIDFNLIEDQSPTHIYSNVVKVRPSDCTIATKIHPSSKVTTQKVVDYLWKDRYTLGHLITYHTHTKLMAYVLAISSSYMIRVLNEESSHRCLIKDFSSEVVDIAFSKGLSPYIASIDIHGWIKVNKIVIKSDLIEAQLVFKIEPRKKPLSSISPSFSCSRVIWCWHNDSDMNLYCKPSPRADQDGSENTQTKLNAEESAIPNTSLLLGVIHNKSFDVIQVDTIQTELRSIMMSENNGGLTPIITRDVLVKISQTFQQQFSKNENNNLSELFLPYLYYVSETSKSIDNIITSFAISNDAAAFAVALQDGTVRFFTLDGSSKTGLKEEYRWKPFENEIVWSLLFLDDSRPGSKRDAFWCHVVVGSSFNREFRLYRCDKWDCVQRISFLSIPASPAEGGKVSSNKVQKETSCLITAHLDESAHFIVASDLRRKVLYVIELGEMDNGQTKLFKSIQEFVLSQPLFSFDINTVSNMVTADGCQQIVIKLCTITQDAFLKMKVSYHTSGHRMGEIQEHITNGEFGGSNGSIITHVSSLQPSVSNSLQDPAIISTTAKPQFPNHLHDQNYSHNGDGPCDNDTESVVPEQLKHLFASATVTAKTPPGGAVILSNEMGGTSGPLFNGTERNPDLPISKNPILPVSSHMSSSPHQSAMSLPSESPLTNRKTRSYELTEDSSDDSGDEASLPDDVNERNSHMRRSNKESEQMVFPIRPPSSNDYDFEEMMVAADEVGQDFVQPSSFNQYKIQQNYDIQNMSSQLEAIQLQMMDLQKTMAAIFDQQQKHEISINQQQKAPSYKPPDIVLNEPLLSRITRKTTTEMSEHLSTKIQSKFSQELHVQLTNVLAPVLQDAIGNNLQDKNMIQMIADSVSETTSRTTKSVLTDVIRKEFTPRLGTLIDRLIEDSGRVIKEGINDVLLSLDNSSQSIQKHVIEQTKKENVNYQNSFQQLLTDMGTWKTEIQSSVNHQALAQTRIIDSLRDIKDTMANLQMASQYDPNAGHIRRGVSMTSLLSSKGATSDQDPTPDQQIQRKLATNDFVSAVTIALNQTNLPLLIATLKRVGRPDNILSQSNKRKSTLPTTSVLCLIQQLSREFSNEFDLKYEYLFASVMFLTFSRKKRDLDEKNSGSVVSNGYIAKVLTGMLRRLQMHLDHDNTVGITNNIRLLIGFVSGKLEDLNEQSQ